VTFCELRLTNVSVPAGCTYAQTSAPICSCFDPIAFGSGKYGPPTTLNASSPGSTELWAFMLYEHIVAVLKFFLMGSFPRVSKYVSDMARAQQPYLQVNAMNEPAPLGSIFTCFNIQKRTQKRRRMRSAPSATSLIPS
jgi:hypothetical protein